MPLDEVDLDRIGDKIKIKMLEALDEHQTKEHRPLERRIAKMQRLNHGVNALVTAAAAFFGLKGN